MDRDGWMDSYPRNHQHTRTPSKHFNPNKITTGLQDGPLRRVPDDGLLHDPGQEELPRPARPRNGLRPALQGGCFVVVMYVYMCMVFLLRAALQGECFVVMYAYNIYVCVCVFVRFHGPLRVCGPMPSCPLPKINQPPQSTYSSALHGACPGHNNRQDKPPHPNNRRHTSYYRSTPTPSPTTRASGGSGSWAGRRRQGRRRPPWWGGSGALFFFLVLFKEKRMSFNVFRERVW